MSATLHRLTSSELVAPAPAAIASRPIEGLLGWRNLLILSSQLVLADTHDSRIAMRMAGTDALCQPIEAAEAETGPPQGGLWSTSTIPSMRTSEALVQPLG